MKTVKINRLDQDWNQTIGINSIYNEQGKLIFTAASLERGWRNNEPLVSCIPPGEYELKLEWSDAFQKKLWEIKNVPNRSETKFHSANYWYQLKGCIALGQRVIDINNDGYCDVTNSKNTMTQFHRAFGNDTEAKLIIYDV